jgi:hypothetical protein
MAVFNRVYSPLGTQISMLVAEGSLKQDYDADNKIYTPDRRIRPTAIQPVCSITDPSGILENGTVNLYITDIKWYENEISEANLISPTNSKYKIDSTSNTNNRGRIIVYKNVNFDAPVTLIFTATFADMVNGKLRRKAYFVGTSVLASNVAASSPVVLKTDYPRGRCFNPIKGLTYLKLSADLVAGETSIPSAYWWYKKNGSAESLITDYVGHNSRELEVPTASIGKEQHYVCKVQDCRQNLTDVRNEYLQKELDKISDYPRNLLAKQYFLDLNDEIKPGVVTEGEDADGKYICVPNPFALRTYIGGNEQRDLFSGKMSFKENTAYVLRVVGKYVSETESQWGFAFIIAYTDGTFSSALRFDYMANKKIEAVHKSTPGKTISHISCTYGFDIPSYIYGIQITEEYNYNLLEGDTEEVTVNASDSNTNYASIPIAKISSKKVTISIDDVVNIAGDATEYSVSMYNYGTVNSIVANFIVLSKSKKTGVLNLTDKYDASQPAIIMLYAGKSGATAGNSVKYSNVQLLEGEYAWNVLGEDVEALIVGDGDENKAQSSYILIDNILSVGGKYTLNIGDITGFQNNTELTCSIQQSVGNTGSIVSNTISINSETKTVTFTINDKYLIDNSRVTKLVFYSGYTSDIIQLKNVRLLYGETVLPSVPAYTPHFIPSAPDIEVESESIQLPEGYRPDVQGKTINHEFTLVTRLPPYRTSVITPYGNDSGVISIPSDVKLFPAWIQVDVAGIGTLDNPEKYFSADWGNGLKGMNVLLDADDIGLGVQEVEPDVVEGMEHVKYAVSGCSLPSANMNKLEEFVEGSRIVVEVPPNTPTKSAVDIYVIKNNIGCRVSYLGTGFADLYIYAYGFRKKANIKNLQKTIQCFEFEIGSTLNGCKLKINGISYTGSFTEYEAGEISNVAVQNSAFTSLIEIYSPENALLHKWDFEGSTDDERLSDKAETENKVNFSKSEGFEFIPV